MAAAEPVATAGQPIPETPLSRAYAAFLAIQTRPRLQLSPQEVDELRKMLAEKPEAEVLAAINQVPLKYERRTIEQVRWALNPKSPPARASPARSRPYTNAAYEKDMENYPRDEDLDEESHGA